MRNAILVGFIATLFIAILSPSLPVPLTYAAEMVEVDKAMVKSTGDQLMALKKELAAVRADLQKLSTRAGSMSQMMDVAVDDYCKGLSYYVRAQTGGLCQ